MRVGHPAHEIVLRGGTIHDGSAGEPFAGDVAIDGDTIAAVGRVDGRGATEIDVRGLAVAPGFINTLSWATESLIEDGRSESDIRRGVTLEVFGEGSSMGPLTEAMRRGRLAPGMHADVVAFDAANIRDNATYERPHRYASGVEHVLVNGVAVRRDGEHTVARPGRVVRRPGAHAAACAAGAPIRAAPDRREWISCRWTSAGPGSRRGGSSRAARPGPRRRAA